MLLCGGVGKRQVILREWVIWWEEQVWREGGYFGVGTRALELSLACVRV